MRNVCVLYGHNNACTYVCIHSLCPHLCGHQQKSELNRTPIFLYIIIPLLITAQTCTLIRAMCVYKSPNTRGHRWICLKDSTKPSFISQWVLSLSKQSSKSLIFLHIWSEKHNHMLRIWTVESCLMWTRTNIWTVKIVYIDTTSVV